MSKILWFKNFLIVTYSILMIVFLSHQEWLFQNEPVIRPINLDELQDLMDQEFLLWIQSDSCKNCIPVEEIERLFAFYNQTLFQINAKELSGSSENQLPTLVYYNDGKEQVRLFGELTSDVLENIIKTR